MKKYVISLFITITVLCGFVLTEVISAYRAEAETQGTLDLGFSVVHITSELDPFVQERELWHSGSISIFNHTNGFHLDETPINIRGRGNSTWWAGPDKRPLRFRFPSGDSQDLLNFGTRHRNWILLANHFDRSLLRNYTAFHLGSLLDGLDNTPRSFFVHLYVNGLYMGVYQLTDERDIGPGRTEITIHPDPFISEFLIEWNLRMINEPNKGYDWVMVGSIAFDIRSPSGSVLTRAHADYVYNYLSDVSASLIRRDFEAFSGLVCLDSFVDFFLVMEFAKDPDSGFASFFMTIRGQGDTRRLVLGPIWDFDLAFGNRRAIGTTEFARLGEYGYSPFGLTATLRNYWFWHAMAMPEFARLVFDRWQQVSGKEVYATITHVEAVGTFFQDEFERNFNRHNIMGIRVWDEPDHIVNTLTHAGQVELLVDWMKRRRQWMDLHFTETHWPGPPLPVELGFN